MEIDPPRPTCVSCESTYGATTLPRRRVALASATVYQSILANGLPACAQAVAVGPYGWTREGRREREQHPKPCPPPLWDIFLLLQRARAATSRGYKKKTRRDRLEPKPLPLRRYNEQHRKKRKNAPVMLGARVNSLLLPPPPLLFPTPSFCQSASWSRGLAASESGPSVPSRAERLP